MKLWQAALQRLGPERSLPTTFGLDEWFSFQGNLYPLGLNTSMNGQKEETPDGTFRSYVQAAYKANGPIFALVLARMLPFSEARFQWRRFEGGRPTALFGDPSLAILERPAPGQTTGNLLARMEQDVSLAGNSFTRRVMPRGVRSEADYLVRLDPSWVTIALASRERSETPTEGGDVELVGYFYTPGGPGSGAEPMFLLPDEVAHYAPIPDPEAVFRGMSWITPVVRDVQGDKATTTHKLRFFENAATPNLAIKFDKSVQPDQVREFKAMLEENHRGAWNAYRTLYLGGGADPMVIGKDFQQLEFSVTQGAGETRIAAAAGVPPIIAGFSEGLRSATYSNYGQARRRFADGTLRPLWRDAAASLETVVDVPNGAHLWYDDRDIAFLREDSKDEADTFNIKARAVRTLTDGGYEPGSVVAAVDTLDLSLLEHTGLLSVQMQPPGNEQDPAADDNANDSDNADAGDDGEEQ